MLKDLLIKIWHTKSEFLRYFVCGISAFVIDILTLYFFKDILHIKATTGVILNQVIIIFYVFLINKYWSFKAKGSTSEQIFKFFLVMLLNYLIAVIWMWWWNEKMHYDYLVVRIVNIAFSVSWNFLLYKFWVYRTISNNVK